jgi:hypothetical protein
VARRTIRRLGSPGKIAALSSSHVNWWYRAPVAQLDRAVASGATGREFESLRAHQIPRRTQM